MGVLNVQWYKISTIYIMRKSVKKLQKRRGGKSMRKTHRRAKMIKGGILTIYGFNFLSNMMFAGKTLHAIQEHGKLKRASVEPSNPITPDINYKNIEKINRVESMKQAEVWGVVQPGIPVDVYDGKKHILVIHEDDFNKLPFEMQEKFDTAIKIGAYFASSKYKIHPLEVDEYIARVLNTYNPENKSFNFSPPEFETPTIGSEYNPKTLNTSDLERMYRDGDKSLL